MNKKKNIAVLISNAGTGTNLQAIIDGIEKNIIHASISIVISDSEDALGLNRALKHNIPIHILEANHSLTHLLTSTYSIDYVALAGWKKIITDDFIELFHHKILNIHPGLIPDKDDENVLNPDGTIGLWNKGKFTSKAIQNFFDQHATYAGSTIHFLTHEFDFGPVLERCFEKILPEDTVETLYSRLKVKENQMYVEALSTLCHPELDSGSLRNSK